MRSQSKMRSVMMWIRLTTANEIKDLCDYAKVFNCEVVSKYETIDVGFLINKTN